MSVGAFEMRVTVIDGTIDNLVVWVREMIPREGPTRSVTEWVEDHIRTCLSGPDLRDLLGVEGEDFQALASGIIRGFRCGPFDEEYDEEVTFSNVEWHKLPPES